MCAKATATMTNSATEPSIGVAGQAVSTRIVSIDIFRGLTMAVMIFVNELAGVSGLPRWTEHAHAMENRMTYVDMVFPFFLFIVGLSMPLAVRQRLRKTNSAVSLWGHILLRSFSLVVLGLILANASRAGILHPPLNGDAWALIALIGAALYLNVYPASPRWKGLFSTLQVIGLATVAVMLILFRRPLHTGALAWLDPSYPEILGLIGFTYFAVCLLYIPTRKWSFAPLVWFALLVLLCIVSTDELLNFPNHAHLWFWPWGNGAMACVTMAGVVTSEIFLGSPRFKTPEQKMLAGAVFGMVLLAAGWALAPLGISKIRATPTWSLVSAGAAVLAFTLLYWICDVRKHSAWAGFVRPAGSNTLLTYLLPDLWFFLFASLGVTYLDTLWAAGWPGVMKTVLFTALMLAIASVLTRLKVRLQL